MLIHLDRLKKQVEKEFPEASIFIRPGLDEPERYDELKSLTVFIEI